MMKETRCRGRGPSCWRVCAKASGVRNGASITETNGITIITVFIQGSIVAAPSHDIMSMTNGR